MAIEYFNAYHSYLKSIEPLNDSERGRLFTALLEYSSTGEVPDVRGNERFIFPTMKEQIDRDKQKYDAKCQKRSESAKKRWDTSECSGMQIDANECKRIQKYANDAKEKTKTKTKTKTKAKDYNPLTPEQESLFSSELLEAVKLWLTYKHERKEDYKPTGLNAMLSEIKNNAAAHGDRAVIDLIRQCMSQNWKGIIWEKLSVPKTQAVSVKDLGDDRRKAEAISEMKANFQKMRAHVQKIRETEGD